MARCTGAEDFAGASEGFACAEDPEGFEELGHEGIEELGREGIAE